MKKVVHVIGALIAGGAETFVVNLAISLSKQINITIVVLSSRSDSVTNDLKAKLLKSGVHIEIGPSEKVGIKTIAWYRSILKIIDPDLVHLHTPNTELVHFFSFRKYIIFRTIHSSKPHFNWLISQAIRSNNAFKSIACGKSVLTSPSTSIFKNKVLIDNGVYFDWPVSNSQLRNDARNKLGLDLTSMHFVSIGRMSAETINKLPKAQDVLISAWKIFEIKNRPKKAVLHLIGDGNLASSLKELANSSNTIVFHGVQANISDWLLAADWFVMPSRFEGLPIAGIEAIGTGIGCIFTEIEPFRQLDPTLVNWVKADNIESLSDAIFDAYSSVTAAINEETTIRFREKFSIESVSRKYLELYRSAICNS